MAIGTVRISRPEGRDHDFGTEHLNFKLGCSAAAQLESLDRQSRALREVACLEGSCGSRGRGRESMFDFEN